MLENIKYVQSFFRAVRYNGIWKGRDSMMKFKVAQGCCFCSECLFACPRKAITMDKNGAHIDPDKCVGCGLCADNCASEAIVPYEA